MTKKSAINIHLYIALLFLLTAGYLALQYLNVQANKKNFQDARVSIDSIFSETKKSLGNPDATKRLSFCGGSQCTVYTSFVYAAVNKNQADDDFHKIQNIIKTQDKLIPAKALSNRLALINGFDGAQDLYSTGKLACTAKYTFDPPQVTLLKTKSTYTKPFYVEIGCSGTAKRNFYNPAPK